MLHSMRETIGMNKRAIGIWWSASLCRDLFFGTDHYGTGRSEKSGCSTQSGTALTRNRELVGTDLPLF